MNIRGTWIIAGALLVAAGPAAALTAADKCEAAKNKIAGKYAFCREKAEAKAIKTGGAPDYSKCDATFSQKWMSAESNGGGMCPTNGDQAAMQSCITTDTAGWAAALNGTGTCAPVNALAQTGQTQCDQGAGTLGACPGSPGGQDGAVVAGAARSYTDNGDGTITDNVTGLMWEKLLDDGTIHDWDNLYTWYTAFTTKIAALNSGSGFAGQTDWRMQNVNELHSLANYGALAPAVDAAFNTACVPACTVTTCSCTQSSHYWSATTDQSNAASAWSVIFAAGSVGTSDKSNGRYVRAVRGGS